MSPWSMYMREETRESRREVGEVGGDWGGEGGEGSQKCARSFGSLRIGRGGEGTKEGIRDVQCGWLREIGSWY